MNAVAMNDHVYRKNQQAASLLMSSGATSAPGSKPGGQPATTAKSLNAMQGRYAGIQQNGDAPSNTAANAYAEEPPDGALGPSSGHENSATMVNQVRMSSKDGVRKKKSQSLARYQYKNA